MIIALCLCLTVCCDHRSMSVSHCVIIALCLCLTHLSRSSYSAPSSPCHSMGISTHSASCTLSSTTTSSNECCDLSPRMVSIHTKAVITVIHVYVYTGVALLWVAALGVVILYIYAVVSFAFLHESFLQPDNNDATLFCQDLGECFVSTIRYGLLDNLGLVRGPPVVLYIFEIKTMPVNLC